MNQHLDFLLSCIYDRDPLMALHREDLYQSGLTDATIEMQKFRSVPPSMIDRLLGFSAPKVNSAYLIPFPDPLGGWFDHIRLKVFPPIETKKGTIKYLQPKHSTPRLYFPLATLDRVRHGRDPIWLIEGEKKGCALAQLGLPAIGFSGIEGWHRRRSPELADDFTTISWVGRTVEIVPDGDVATNPNVRRGVERLARALAASLAHPRMVALPAEVPAA